MGKASNRKSAAPRHPVHTGKKKTRLWQGLYALVVLSGLAGTLLLLYRPATPAEETGPENPASTTAPSGEAGLQNRSVLPATPREPRPKTLDPSQFADPQTMTSYQIAQIIPQVLERLPCYCGCYQSVGHRNNLDCFTDEHGVT